MTGKPLPEDENIYDTLCPILYAMKVIGQTINVDVIIKSKNTLFF